MGDGGSAIPSVDRPVMLRMRPDLLFHPRESRGSRWWVVKDPVALTYFQLQEEEVAILRMLDGRTSLAQIEQAFLERFAPLRLRSEQITAFLSRLHQMGLVVSNASGQARQLSGQFYRDRRRARMAAAMNPLAIRVGAVDPEPFLAWFAPKVAWLFSFWFLSGCLAMSLSALLLVAVQFNEFQTRLPDLQTFLAPGNLAWLAVALMIVKVVHELGHALACKRFGGECHEIGLLLLVFTPCLYCDVSDAWLIPSKWRRIAVSAAGMIVELVLAGLCTFLWWFTTPGLLNSLFLNMVVVCSVGTVLFNGNPLLRYDGYYVLSDLLGIPNLGSRSRALVWGTLCRWSLGIESFGDRSLPGFLPRLLLACYGVAAMLYRWFVVAVVLWICYRALVPYGLEVVAGTIAMVVLVGMMVPLVKNAHQYLQNPANRSRIRRRRAYVVAGLLLLAAAAALWIPLPYRVSGPAVLYPEDARRVYVTVAGTLEDTTAAGCFVEQGDCVARLINREVDREVIELAGRRHQQAVQLQSLQARRVDEPQFASQMPAVQQALLDLDEQLAYRRQDQERLSISAPVSGTIIPPPIEPDQFYQPGVLPGRIGSPLETRAVGSYLQVGELLCLIGDPNRLEAILTIDQADWPYVCQGQRVRLLLDELPGKVLMGRVADLSQIDLKVAPRELAGQSELAIRRDNEGIARPATTSYQVRVRMENCDVPLRVGTRGRGKVLVAPQPLGTRIYRSWRRLFRLSGP